VIRAVKSHIKSLGQISVTGWITGFTHRWRSEVSGQAMVEYAIVVALIALVAIAAIQALGGGISQLFQNILGHIQGVGQ
jgi:pilus assembly protein Flp/PilA